MSASFDTLLKDFAASKGLPADEATYGLEFESEGHSVMVVQHPLHEDHLLVEVSVAVLPVDPSAVLLAMLLQINEAARFEHDWAVYLDGEQQVSLSTAAPLADLSLAEIEGLMLDGVERAQALQALLNELPQVGGGEGDSVQAPLGGGLDSMMLRG